MEKWKGFKDFTVWKIVKENEYIVSLYFKAVEKGELPDYLPGQFIAIRIPFGDTEYSQTRQYTLSTLSNGEYYKISVKREEEGNISKILCDELQEGDRIQVTVPLGKFVLKDDTTPVVLIGGGIGITPMLTMAMEAAKEQRHSHLIYCLPNSSIVAFHKEIDQLDAQNENFEKTIVYSRPLEQDVKGKDYDVSGRLSKEWLQRHIDPASEVYFCGPVEFMRSIYRYMIELGIDKEKIHYELFTPGEDITK